MPGRMRKNMLGKRVDYSARTAGRPQELAKWFSKHALFSFDAYKIQTPEAWSILKYFSSPFVKWFRCHDCVWTTGALKITRWGHCCGTETRHGWARSRAFSMMFIDVLMFRWSVGFCTYSEKSQEKTGVGTRQLQFQVWPSFRNCKGESSFCCNCCLI